MKEHKADPQAEAPETRTDHISYSNLVSNYVKVTDKNYGYSGGGTYNGAWGGRGPEGANVWRTDETWDLKGRTAEDNYGLGQREQRAYLSLVHSDYDAAPDPEVDHYTVEFKIHGIYDMYADGSRQQHEWYLDHSAVTRQSESTPVQLSALAECPRRDDPVHGSGGSDHPISNFDAYPPMICRPGAIVGVVCKGFEKDSVRPGSYLDEHFGPSLKDWADLWYDAMKALVTKKIGEVVGDVCSILVTAAISNDDDPMVPVAITLTGGACRFIAENVPERRVYFYRQVYGFNSKLYFVDGAPSDWYNQPHVRTFDFLTTRRFRLWYSITVTKVPKATRAAPDDGGEHTGGKHRG